MRKYEQIWHQIKQASVNSPDQWVVVTVRDASMIQTIINMVQVEKSRQQVARRALDLPGFGKLRIKREQLKVSFKIDDSGDLL